MHIEVVTVSNFSKKNSIYLQFTQTTGKGKLITNKKTIKNLKTKE